MTHVPIERVQAVREELKSSRRLFLGTAAASAVALGALKLPTAPHAAAQQFKAQHAQAFANTTFITINDGNNATPYPSPIQVSGMVGGITSISVAIYGLQHTNPRDVAIMLVSPTGVAKVVMNGVGADFNIAGVNLYVSDSATAFMPEASILETDSYKPTNAADTGVSAGITFPIPGQGGVATPVPGENFTAFNGLGTFNANDVNGIWRLYVRDTAQNDFWGQITSGWGLGITTNIDEPIANRDVYNVKAGKTLQIRHPGVLRNDRDRSGGKLRLAQEIHKNTRLGRLTVKRNGALTFVAKENVSGRQNFNYTVVSSTGLSATGRITIVVKP